MTQELPKFENPPVVEVALSVQFDRLEASTTQFGLAWQRFRDRFGTVEEKPELEPSFERFDPPKKAVPGVSFKFNAFSVPRLWFLNDSGNELLQLQRDRFVRNWRKTEGQPDYPQYDNLRGAFLADWTQFVSFVSEELRTQPVPNQVEVTYVNIIESIGGNSILTCLSETYSDDYLTAAEASEIQLRYVLSDDENRPWGRLHIASAPVVRTVDDEPVVRLSLTARGAPGEKNTDGAMQALDACHVAVVRGFASVTSTQMHSTWGRRS